jgi:hypothetical protein
VSFLKLIWSRPSAEIPADLRKLCELREGDIYYNKADAKSARLAMDKLGVHSASEFYAFFSTFVIENMHSDHDNECLSPITSFDGEPSGAILFAHETWDMPNRYIALTTLEGEGGYFYDNETGAVIDYENGGLEDLLRGNVKIINSTLFGFMRWFLS